MPYLSPEAKAKLSTTIRSLRERLLTDLSNAAESTYRFSIHLFSKKQLEPRAEVEFDPKNKAGLLEEGFQKRLRIEQWFYEQVRAETGGKVLKDEKKERAIWDRHLHTAIKLAAATLLNRLIVIHQLEALGLMRYKVVTGGWSSSGYRGFRDFAPDLCKDDTEGYGTLLQLLYDELALEMPGLFGRVGLTELFPIPASTLRAVVEVLDALDPDTWLDDTTLGWVYQYWNDPEREALDAKLNAGGKVEPHEVASKTQMFTERYMVEWLLHNSLGQMWLSICQAQGWTAEVQADGTLDRLESRRKIWREKREKGEVALDELMPIETEAEEHWKYWVPQPLTEAAIAHAPESIREVKILDPACGSGHFLVIAFGLLFALYQEEARHQGEAWSDKEIVESILANNLYGVDIDARSVQIAAAALYLKAKSLCGKAELTVLNLVASGLNLSALPEDDPALVELRREVLEATGIPEELTNQIVQALKGADQWGSLLKIDREVEKAIAQYEQSLLRPVQGKLDFDSDSLASSHGEGEQEDLNLPLSTGREFRGEGRMAILLEKLETFLNRRTHGDDLGLRLRGEQLTAGVRFIRMIRENAYDVVVGNPPYQGASKMDDAKYLIKYYPKSKADLYATFLERGLQLAKEGGISALLTMRNWMFIQQYTPIREYLLDTFDLRLLGDVDRGAFEETLDEVVATVMSVFQKFPSSGEISIAMQPTPLDDNSRDRYRTNRKRSAVLAQVGRFEFKSDRFAVIKEKPIVYWWDDELLNMYQHYPVIGDISPARATQGFYNNTRFFRKSYEVNLSSIQLEKNSQSIYSWVPLTNGADGSIWFEPLREIARWGTYGCEPKLYMSTKTKSSVFRYANEQFFFVSNGIAYTGVGSNFAARMSRYAGVFADKGRSLFSPSPHHILCLLNSGKARNIVLSLNPSISFQAGDVNRLPLFPIESADEIFTQLDRTFTQHEAARETSVEFKQPGASCWNYAQQWAQQAVDRPSGKPLPEWNPVYEEPLAVNWVSYAVGVALGRFGANGEGIRSPLAPLEKGGTELSEVPLVKGDLGGSLPHGILYLSAYSGDQPDSKDSLNHPASQPIKNNWKQYSSKIAKNASLRDWLRLNFFKDVHVKLYEQRPIYFPLSSKNKNFVAFVSIHHWTDNTLQTLLADYLMPELSQLEGEVADLLEAKGRGDSKAQAKAEKRYTEILQLRDELKTFISLVQQCAEQGAPKANPKDPDREANARFKMDLDDGVMVNSAALWCLIDPQWNKPKTWWSELCTAQGKKDYDWSHLAARYFPDRVDAKCQTDPSLAVAHGCFWKYHPAKAYEWELRLQDEIAPDFTIDEANSDALRQLFEDENPDLVAILKEKEEKRRDRKYKKQGQIEIDLDDSQDDELEEQEDE
jgi:hypothetical protein